MELIAVVMGAEDSKVRFNACKTMLDHGFANYSLFRPDLCDAVDVPVTLGKAATVSPRMGETAELLIDKTQKGTISTEIQLEQELSAPVSQGQILGTMTIKSGEQILKEIPLVAAQNVDRLTFGEIYLSVLRQAAMAQAA
jgi:D-alanyl-D-alanine carboxypeptidase (penicillin-binding protein 5/6)